MGQREARKGRKEGSEEEGSVGEGVQSEKSLAPFEHANKKQAESQSWT